jgi:hypothetical protein
MANYGVERCCCGVCCCSTLQPSQIPTITALVYNAGVSATATLRFLRGMTPCDEWAGYVILNCPGAFGQNAIALYLRLFCSPNGTDSSQFTIQGYWDHGTNLNGPVIQTWGPIYPDSGSSCAFVLQPNSQLPVTFSGIPIPRQPPAYVFAKCSNIQQALNARFSYP